MVKEGTVPCWSWVAGSNPDWSNLGRSKTPAPPLLEDPNLAVTATRLPPRLSGPSLTAKTLQQLRGGADRGANPIILVRQHDEAVAVPVTAMLISTSLVWVVSGGGSLSKWAGKIRRTHKNSEERRKSGREYFQILTKKWLQGFDCFYRMQEH